MTQNKYEIFQWTTFAFLLICLKKLSPQGICDGLSHGNRNVFLFKFLAFLFVSSNIINYHINMYIYYLKEAAYFCKAKCVYMFIVYPVICQWTV